MEYTDFETILKPFDKQYRKKMFQIKTKKNVKDHIQKS